MNGSHHFLKANIHQTAMLWHMLCSLYTSRGMVVSMKKPLFRDAFSIHHSMGRKDLNIFGGAEATINRFVEFYNNESVFIQK